jgi:hypothetical protein
MFNNLGITHYAYHRSEEDITDGKINVVHVTDLPMWVQHNVKLYNVPLLIELLFSSYLQI